MEAELREGRKKHEREERIFIFVLHRKLFRRGYTTKRTCCKAGKGSFVGDPFVNASFPNGHNFLVSAVLFKFILNRI